MQDIFPSRPCFYLLNLSCVIAAGKQASQEIDIDLRKLKKNNARQNEFNEIDVYLQKLKLEKQICGQS